MKSPRLRRATVGAGDVKRHVSALADPAICMPAGGRAKDGRELRGGPADFDRFPSIERLGYTHGGTRLSGDLALHDCPH